MVSKGLHTSKGRVLLIAILLGVLCTAHGCMKKRRAAPWPEKTWATASPESQGLDSSVLASAVRTIRSENINIHSILLIRNGFAVLDVFFYPYDGRRLHDAASVTKSITATLVGQAVSEGILPGLDVPVRDLLSTTGAGKAPGAWSAVTLENLLTMSSGLECGKPPVEEKILVLRNSPNWVDASLSLPVVQTPGERFDYCSPNFHLLSAAVARAAGTSLADFARGHLFEPLGIDEYSWPADPQGVTIGWGDLRLHPYAMAKIGYLYMNDGLWKGQRILPAGWVKSATTPRLSTPGGDGDYGYGWWLARGRFKGVYEARGRGGQSITVWPEARILLVTTGGGYPRDPVIELLLPAVKSNSPLPENPGALEDLTWAVSAAAMAPEPASAGTLPPMARQVSGQRYDMEENLLGLEVLTAEFASGSAQARLTARISGREYRYTVGLDGVYRFSETSPSGDPAALRGQWETGERFILDYNEVTRINRFRMEFTFSGDDVALVFSEPTGQIAGKVMGHWSNSNMSGNSKNRQSH